MDWFLRRGGVVVAGFLLLAGSGLPLTPAGAAPDGGGEVTRIRPELRKRIAAQPGRAQDSIVVLRPGSDEAAVRRVAAGVGVRLESGEAYSIIPAFRARLRPSEIAKVAHDPQIAVVSENGRVRASLQTARRWFGVDAAYDRGYTGGDSSATASGATDAVVAVADTGIDTETPELAGKVIAFVDCTASTPSVRQCTPQATSDPNGHGTHVAGIAAGAGVDPALRGVAPGAALVGIRILGADGGGTFDSVIAGIQWAAAHQGGAESIDVLNLSIGVPCSSSCDSHVLSLAVNAARADGLAVVVAAGNAGPGRGTVEVPGAASGAITVGAISDIRPGDGEPVSSNHGYRIASFSSRGPASEGRAKPDLVAPGVSIRAACSHDAPPPSLTRDGCPDAATHSTVISGTSMAAPFVSGTVALLRDAVPTLSPADVKAVLTGTAVPWGSDDAPTEPGHQSLDYGAGRLDVSAAVAAVANPDPVTPSVPVHGHAAGSLVAGAGSTACFEFTSSSDFPLVATVLEPAGGSSNDLRVTLQNAAGTTVALSSTAAGSTSIEHRQDVASYEPASGLYRAIVEVVAGSSTFDLDVSNAEGFGPCAPRVLAFSVVDAGPSPGTAAPGFTNGDVRFTFTPDAANGGASWMVTTTLDTPAPDAAGWQPLSATDADISSESPGTVTLYPWLRSTLGAVSSSADAAARAATITLDVTDPTVPGSPAIFDADGFVRAHESASVTWTPVSDEHLGSAPIALELVDGADLGASGTLLGTSRPNTGSAEWVAPDDRELPAARVRVIATDQAGNQASAVASGSVYVMRLGGYWADAFGGVHHVGDVPGVDETRRFGFRIARGLAVLPGVDGGYLLDGYGGIHRFAVGGGQLPGPLANSPYWNGWDIAHDIAIAPDGSGGYVLDGYGGIHPVGSAPDVEGAPYFGWDIARRIVLAPTGSGGYVLDGFGGIHVFNAKGSAPPPGSPRGPYFGFDIARGLVVRSVPGGVAGYGLDGYGGLHPVAFGGAASPPGAAQGPYWAGWDITRGIQLLADGGGGYVLDGYGGIHPWRAHGQPLPPTLPGTGYSASDLARAFASR